MNKLQKEIEILRNSIDNCLPIDTAENEDVWQKINLLVELEIEAEKEAEK